MLRSCTPPNVQYNLATRWAHAGVTVVSNNEISTFVQTPTPKWAVRLYREIASVLVLEPPPALIWVQDALGYGGVHAGRFIAIGDADIRQLATEVWNSRFTRIPADRRSFYFNTATRNELHLAVAKVLMAHELGHAHRLRTGTSELGIPEERGADVITGWIAEMLGWTPWLDELIMAHIGCRASVDVCGHPSPRGRVKAYREGREACRAHLEQEELDAQELDAQELERQYQILSDRDFGQMSNYA